MMKFFKKLVTTFLGIGSNAIYQVLFLALISKFYSMEELGVYAFLFSASTVSFFFTNLGFRQLIVTSSKYKSLFQYFRIRVILSSVTVVFICVLCYFVYPEHILLSLYIGLIKLFESLSEIGYSYYQQKNDHSYQSRMLLSKSIFSSLCAFALIYNGLGIDLVVFFILVIHTLFFLTYEFKKVKEGFGGDKLNSGQFISREDIALIRYAFPLGLGLFFINLNLNLSRILSGIFLPEFDTAVLAASLQLSLSLSPVVTGFCQVILPGFTSQLQKCQYNSLYKNYITMSMLFVISSVTLIFIAFFWGKEVLTLIYNKEVGDSYIVFLVCLVGASFNYMAALSTALLTSLEKYDLQSNVMIGCVLINLATMLLFVSDYGLESLIWSFAVSSFLRMIMLYFYSFKFLNNRMI